MRNKMLVYAAIWTITVLLIPSEWTSAIENKIIGNSPETKTVIEAVEDPAEEKSDSALGEPTEEEMPDDSSDTEDTELREEENITEENVTKEIETEETETEEDITSTTESNSDETLEISQEVLPAAVEYEVDASVQKTMYSTATLNVRSGPSTDYEKIGQLSFGQAIEVTGQADTGWYQISYNGETGYVSDLYLADESPISTVNETSHVISDFQIIYQNPELPTGCESVALTMLVNYYSVYADKLDMADNYLPKQANTFYYDENGKKIGPDMENYFVGDPRGVGHICGVPAIMTEADTWLEAQGSDLRSVDLTGISFEELYAYIDNDTPVMVWVTIYMADRRTTQGWYTEDGRWMEYATNDHGAVLIGYSDTTVTIADPISGIVEYSRTQFEKVFSSRGNNAIILQ